MTPETKEAIERLKMDLDFFDSLADEEGFRDGRGDDLRTLIAAIEAMEPRPIEEAPGSHESEEQVLVIGPYSDGWTLTKTDGDWWRQQKREGLKSLPTHFIPLSALPQPEVMNDG